MTSRRYSFVALCSSALALAALAGCGGAKETDAKTGSDAAKTDAAKTDVAKTDAAKTDAAKADGAKGDAVKADEKKPEAKSEWKRPARKREKFEVPNVEFMEDAEPKPIKIGGKEVKAEACALDTSSDLVSESFSEAIRGLEAGPDGALYVVDKDEKVRRYIAQKGDKCVLALDPKFGQGGILAFPEKIERIQVLADGRLIGHTFNTTYIYKDGNIETLDGCKGGAISPDGKVAYEWFMNDVNKGEFTSECPERKSWTYKGWESFTSEDEKPNLHWVKDFGKEVAVAGSAGVRHYVTINGTDGKAKFRLGKDNKKEAAREGEEICWAADVEKCGAGYCLLDSNCRRLGAWEPKKGAFVDSVEISALLKLSYCWPIGLVVSKGVSYMAVTNSEKLPEGAPKDVKELTYGMIFRITGLD